MTFSREYGFVIVNSIISITHNVSINANGIGYLNMIVCHCMKTI